MNPEQKCARETETEIGIGFGALNWAVFASEELAETANVQ
jgi:hypothetical protein